MPQVVMNNYDESYNEININLFTRYVLEIMDRCWSFR